MYRPIFIIPIGIAGLDTGYQIFISDDKLSESRQEYLRNLLDKDHGAQVGYYYDLITEVMRHY